MRRLLLVILCWVPAAWSADPSPPAPLLGCPVDPGPDIGELPPADAGDDRIELLTGKAEVDLNAGAVFSDGIRIRRGDGVLAAPAARFDQATGRFSLEGGLVYRDPKSAITGQDAEFDTRANELRVDQADFQIFAIPSRGSAGSITVQHTNELRLKDVTYTTCSKAREDWLMRAGKITIDREKGIGTARNARLIFKGVPILYTPWISYPVTNRRKTGFLLPSIGRSENRGFEVQVPFYINLAPNYDATLTPRYMAERGTQLISEGRYLWTGHEGTVEAEILPNDDNTGDNRYLLGLQHKSLIGESWRATFNGRGVSDTRYFEDLYGSSSATSQTHLERVLELEHYDDIWSVVARFQDFQTLDESLTGDQKPYRRMPQVAASAFVPGGLLGLDWRLDTELSIFQRDTGVTGSRLFVSPGVALPLRYRGFSLEPSIEIEHTGYSLDETGQDEPNRPSRTTPIYTVDLATVFERGVRGSSGWLQTLEPRIQYVRIPFRDQDDLPVFDTIEPDFNLVQLFRKNRFLGYDRLGDTDQLNFGLTTRLINAANGAQALTATIGQTRFFSAQDVTLPGGTAVDNNSSDWLAEVGLIFRDRWRFNLGYQWNSDENRSERGQARLQYRRDGHSVVNLSYRYRRDSLEDVDVSAAWPLTERWSVVGRYDYSVLDGEPIETFAGVEYGTCCWGLRLVYRRYLASRTGENDTAIAVQLVLKGLTNIGDRADQMLERGILGYESE